jgi:hypothetical protein
LPLGLYFGRDRNRLTCVQFAWNPTLVELRRQVCPGAQWQQKGRRWIMNEGEAQRFLQAAQTRLDLQRSQAQITVDDVAWIVGFVHGAPYRASPAALPRGLEPE